MSNLSKYIALDGDRLDIVVFKTYETLENFEEVLKANPHLLQKDILNSGDIVYLPPYVKKENEEVKALWN